MPVAAPLVSLLPVFYHLLARSLTRPFLRARALPLALSRSLPGARSPARSLSRALSPATRYLDKTKQPPAESSQTEKDFKVRHRALTNP